MTQFTDLPNEIVAQIAQNVHPRDIVNFSSTSKFIHKVSEPSVKVHYEMKRKYKNRKCLGKGFSLAWLLSDIILQPIAALYVECLAIKTCSSRRYTPPDRECGPYATSDQKTMSSFTKGIVDTVPSDQVSTWTAALESGDETPILAMLLLRLPGLVTLKLRIGIPLQCEFDTWVHWLEAPGIPFLSVLTTLCLDWESCYKCPEQEAISYFAILPSLRSMTIQNFSFEPPDDDSEYLLQPRSSNVTSIIIEKSRVEEEALHQFLQGFKALRRFSYEKNRLYLTSSMVYTALLAHCKASLEYLVLKARWGPIYMGSLRGFENLREVETYRTCLWDFWHLNYAVLAKELPASIEKVHLHEDEYATPKTIQDMILNAAKDKQEHLPNLQELRISLYTDSRGLEDMAATADMQAKCEEAGFKLIIERGAKKNFELENM